MLIKMGKRRLMVWVVCICVHCVHFACCLHSSINKSFNNSQADWGTDVTGNKSRPPNHSDISKLGQNVPPDESRHLQVFERKSSEYFKRRQPPDMFSLNAYVSKESDMNSEDSKETDDTVEPRSFGPGFVDPLSQKLEVSSGHMLMPPLESLKKIRKPVVSEETEEEFQTPPSTPRPTRPPFWLLRKLKTQLLHSVENEGEHSDESDDQLATLGRLFPQRSTTSGRPVTRHVHTWKNRRVIEIGSSESIEIVRRRKTKPHKVPPSSTNITHQITTVPPKLSEINSTPSSL